MINGKGEGAILEKVEEDKEYQISLSASYADGAQSEAVAIRYSTCEYTMRTRMKTLDNNRCIIFLPLLSL